MKNWWLDLYTIPALKQLGRAWLVVLIAAHAVVFFLPSFSSLALMLNGYLCYTFYQVSKKSVGANVEFHKLHIPYPTLRRAYVLDLFLRSLCFLCMNLASNYLIVPGSQFENYAICFTTSLFVILFAIPKKPHGTSSYELLEKKSMHPFVHFMFTSVMGFAFMFIVLFWAIVGFHPMPVMFFAGLGLALGYGLFFFKAVFHLEKKKGSWRTCIRYFTKGMGHSGALYALAIVLCLPFINSTAIDPVSRTVFYQISGPFSPKLELPHAIEILQTNRDDPKVTGQVYEENPELGMTPITTIFKEPKAIDYYYFAKYSEQPSKENLLFIMERLSKVKNFQDIHEATSKAVVRRWPKNVKFPEHLIAKKIQTQENRTPASDP